MQTILVRRVGRDMVAGLDKKARCRSSGKSKAVENRQHPDSPFVHFNIRSLFFPRMTKANEPTNQEVKPLMSPKWKCLVLEGQ